MVVLLWDMDGKTTERKRGLLQAREAAALPPGCEGMAIAYGCPDFEIEAWLLGGFQPRDDDERERLAAQHATLGFDPVTQAHRLTAARDHDKHGVPNPRSAKVVLASLTADDHARRQACWQETPLVTLRQRGEHNGLRDYLDEVLHAVDSWAGKNVRLA
ncbi:MAG: hypothetical protein HC863_00485 [Myxococcales bacterium]|nr:hypothetical protein [Myxococcales bacterium]